MIEFLQSTTEIAGHGFHGTIATWKAVATLATPFALTAVYTVASYASFKKRSKVPQKA